MCKAACNGPYDGRWSKTMIGYGPEIDHFVLELTYNYGIDQYKLGNDLVSIKIESKKAYDNVINQKMKIEFLHKNEESIVLNSPDGYLFEIHNPSHDKSLITKVALSTACLNKSKNYWHNLLGMKVIEETSKSFIAKFRDQDASLEMVDTNGQMVRHEKAYGRIAFACAESELKPLSKKEGQTILTDLVKLDTPGKATVEVVIVADPDKHEICFVGEKGFNELSQVDPKANELLETAMEEDKSDEWFKKKGKEKSKCE